MSADSQPLDLRQGAWIKSFAVKRFVTKVVRNCGEKREIVASAKKTPTVDWEREALFVQDRWDQIPVRHAGRACAVAASV